MNLATKFYRRHRHSLTQFWKFGLIGGSGVLVNLAAVAAFRRLALWLLDKHEEAPLLRLLGSDFHVRWYHVIVTLAFIVANVWNFQLNRTLTFKSAKHARWFKEFVPFFLAGLLSFGIGLLIITALINVTSPVHLPRSIFDGSSGLRRPLYWATLIQIVLTTPLNFILSKFWAFRAMRGVGAGLTTPSRPEDAPVGAGTATKPPCAD